MACSNIMEIAVNYEFASYAQPMNNDYSLSLPFPSRLYEFYLSITYLEKVELNLLQNLILCTPKSVSATSTRPLGEVGGMSPL